MKLKSGLKVGGKQYAAGDQAPMFFIYPFFLFHMAMFGFSGFLMAYGSDSPDLGFLYMHGGIAIGVYLVFYLAIFGLDEVKWMLINAGLGLFGIWSEIDTILGWFDKSLGDFSPWVHVTPFLYYIRVPAESRDALRAGLKEAGVDTGIHWQPGHWFSLFKDARRGDLGITDAVGAQVLSLPLHSMMEPDTVDQVCDAIAAFYAKWRP